MADCLIGVVSQRLQFRPNLNICVPECEVLMATMAVKNFIRNRDFFKIISSIETGAEHSMWSYARYRAWLDKQTNFNQSGRDAAAGEEETETDLQPLPRAVPELAPPPGAAAPATGIPPRPLAAEPDRIEIEPTETFEKILKPKS